MSNFGILFALDDDDVSELFESLETKRLVKFKKTFLYYCFSFIIKFNISSR